MKILPFIIFVAVGGILFCFLLFQEQFDIASENKEIIDNKSAPEVMAESIDGYDFSTIANLKNQNILINFFASWCVPCLAEHKLIKELSKNDDLVIYGIAWKDSSDNIKNWLEKNGNPYKYVALDSGSKTAISYGLTGVPESFLINKKGKIVFHHAGVLTQAIIDENIMSLLDKKMDNK